MKKRAFGWCIIVLSLVFAALLLAALFLLRGALRTAVCAAFAALWTIFFIRFFTLRYTFTEDEIRVSVGFIFRSEKTVKRSAILSQSRSYAGRHLLYTVIRTSGSTEILFCSLPDSLSF